MALAVTDFGKLDVLVNNAGMIIYHPLAETPLADFIRQFEIDQLGVFLGLRAAYPALKRSGNASVINTASTAGTRSHARSPRGLQEGSKMA